MSKKNAAKKVTVEEVSKVEEIIENNREDLEAARSLARESVKELATKSAKIRALAAQGYPTKEIAKILGIIYQHARNVLTTPLKRPLAKQQAEARQQVEEVSSN